MRRLTSPARMHLPDCYKCEGALRLTIKHDISTLLPIPPHFSASAVCQVALRAPLSHTNTLSKAATPIPGMSRAGSSNMGQSPAVPPPLPPIPPAAATAAATSLLVAGPGAAPSAPLPLSGSVAAAAAAAVAAEGTGS